MNCSSCESTVKSATTSFPFSGPKIHLRVRHILVVALLALLAGCVSPPPPPRLTPYPPFTCDSFTESYWQEFRFGVDSVDDVDDIVAKIVKLWDLDSTRVQIEPMSEKGVVIQWQVEFHDGADPRYTAHFHEDLKLTSVFFQWWNREPTLALVINCLGVPEHYAAYYEQGVEARALKVDLWYVDKGFIVRGFSFHGQDQPPRIGPEYRMDYFTATVPGKLERMISTMYDPKVLALILCPIRPWPGSIEAIEVESLLENPRCSL